MIEKKLEDIKEKVDNLPDKIESEENLIDLVYIIKECANIILLAKGEFAIKRKREYTIYEIIEEVSKILKVKDIFGKNFKNRLAKYVFARYVVYYLCLKLIDTTAYGLGKYFGINHGLILYGLKEIEKIKEGYMGKKKQEELLEIISLF